LSPAILLGWASLIQRPQPQSNNANSTQQQAANANSTPAQPTNANPVTSQTQQPTDAAIAPDTIPRRVITISTALSERQLDRRGAVATSWIINKNKITGRELRSVAGDKHNHK